MRKWLLLGLALLAVYMGGRAARRNAEVLQLLWALVGLTATASTAGTAKSRSTEDRLTALIPKVFPNTGGTISGPVTVNGSHTVNGNMSVSGSHTVGGQVNAGTVSASGAATSFGFTSHGNGAFDGNVTVGGNHNVSGQVNASAIASSGAMSSFGFTSHGGLSADGTLTAANFSGTFSGSHSGSYAGGQPRPSGYPIGHGTPWEDQVIDVINSIAATIVNAHVSNQPGPDVTVVQHAANKAVFSSGTSGTLTVTLGSATGAGNCLVACITASNAASATPSVTAVKTGASAENWAAAKTVNDTTQSGYATIWTDQNTGGGATTVNITVTFGQTDSGSAETVAAADVYEVSGVGASGAVDVTVASTNGNSGTAWSSGTSGTTSQASEIAFGAALCVPTSGGTATITPPAAYTNSTVQSQAYTGSFGAFTLYSVSGYKTLTTTGTVVYNGTASSASYWDACAVTVKYSAAVSGAASLSGSGSASPGGALAGAAVLDGEGTLSAAAGITIPGAAALLGQGTLGGTAEILVPGAGSAGLFGQGALGGSRTVTWAGAAPLAGRGTASAQETGLQLQAASLNGQGSLGFNVSFGIQAALGGAGTLSIPQVAGGLVNGVGGVATPMALPGSSQVAVAPPGSGNWQWLGTLGQVTALTYSYVCPGGADKMSMTIMCPASYRTQLFNPGWSVKIVRGGHDIWHGKLDEPQPSAQGWTLTAVGNGQRGTDFVSFFAPGDVWPAGEPDEIINRAIARGLPWVNPGLNSSPYFSQFWLGQGADPGSQSVTAFLNLICTRGGLVWYVNSQPGGVYAGDDLGVFPLPTVPNRLLVSTTPVARTLGGDINTIFIRYCSVADNSSASPPVAASYDVVAAVNAQSVAAHGTLETYIDLSDVGQMSSSAAQSVGNSVLQLYQRASFAGPFQASYGQLLNTGGAPVDPGCDQAGTVLRLILSDWGLGGEVQPGPITVICGSYSWDDFRQIATISPMQTLDMSLSGLLSMTNTTMVPVTTASTGA